MRTKHRAWSIVDAQYMGLLLLLLPPPFPHISPTPSGLAQIQIPPEQSRCSPVPGGAEGVEGVPAPGELGRDCRGPCHPRGSSLCSAAGLGEPGSRGLRLAQAVSSGTGASASGVAGSRSRNFVAWGLVAWLPVPDVPGTPRALG